MRRFVIVMLVGCAGAAARESQPVAAVHNVPDHRGHLVGRVLLDGHPVRYFGVSIVKAAAIPIFDAPVPIHTSNGRFDVVVDRSAHVDIVVAGPGFVRRVIAGQDLVADQTVDVGTVDVQRGRTIEGHVTRQDGTPVDGADVKIMQVAPGGDPLRELANGNLWTTTDIDGFYRIDDVWRNDIGGIRPRITAVVDGKLGALPRHLDDLATTPRSLDVSNIDLVLSPVGEIYGTATRQRANSIINIAVVGDPKPRLGAMTDPDGSFVVRNVPAGDYDVSVNGQGAQTVTVVADQTATVLLR